MKWRAFWVGSAVLVVLVLWFLRSSITTNTSDVSQQSQIVPRKTNPPKELKAVRDSDEPEGTSRAEKKVLAFRKALEEGNIPIRFWGIVEDQTGRPLQGVLINADVRKWVESARSTPSEERQKFELMTDNEGKFEIVGAVGDALTITGLTKPGHELSNAIQRDFIYLGVSEPFVPDPKRRVVFRMWKKAGAERLIAGDKFYGIVPDGRLYGVDLLRAQKIERHKAGDFAVQIIRPAQVVDGMRYEWSFVIEGIDGGVIETNDEFMYLAPEHGYQERYDFSLMSSAPGWQDSVQKKFYLKSRGGTIFGRLEIEVFSNYKDQAVFSVKSFVNPAGSRNLEFDPRQNLARQ